MLSQLELHRDGCVWLCSRAPQCAATFAAIERTRSVSQLASLARKTSSSSSSQPHEEAAWYCGEITVKEYLSRRSEGGTMPRLNRIYEELNILNGSRPVPTKVLLDAEEQLGKKNEAARTDSLRGRMKSQNLRVLSLSLDQRAHPTRRRSVKKLSILILQFQ